MSVAPHSGKAKEGHGYSSHGADPYVAHIISL